MMGSSHKGHYLRQVSVDLSTGKIINLSKGRSIQANPFSDVQMEIYQNGGLF